MTAAISSAAATARRHRWAVSFADLLLLLLGFFVMLHASGARRDALLAQVSQQFGGRALRPGVELRAADLFVPNEALLSPQGRARLAVAARPFVGARGAVEIGSHGADRARQRFDEWDLAAARLGAVARALQADGVGGDRLVLRGLDQAERASGQGQVITIASGPVRPH